MEMNNDGVRTNADVLLCNEWTFTYWKQTVLPQYENLYRNMNR